MARIEESERPGDGRAREWFDRALAAPPDPAYACARCGGENAEWQALCGHCRGFDTLAWRAPKSVSAPAATILPPALAEPPVLLPLPDGLASAGQSVR
jgi:HemY protein